MKYKFETILPDYENIWFYPEYEKLYKRFSRRKIAYCYWTGKRHITNYFETLWWKES